MAHTDNNSPIELRVTVERLAPEPPKPGFLAGTLTVALFAALVAMLALSGNVWVLYAAAGAYGVWLLIR